MKNIQDRYHIKYLIILTAFAYFLLNTILGYHYFNTILNNSSYTYAFRNGFFLMGVYAVSFCIFSTGMEYRSGDSSIPLFFGIQVICCIDLLTSISIEFFMDNRILMTLALIIIYLDTPIDLVLFWFYQNKICSGKKVKISKVNVLIVFLCILDCFFIIYGSVRGFMFTMNRNMTYHIGPWNKYTYVFPFLLLSLCILNAILTKTTIRKKHSCILYATLPVILAVIAFRTGNTIFSHTANVFGVMIIYTGIQFERDHELQLQDKQLHESMVNAAILQINPHFIQNCLTSIRDLMYLDIGKADNMLIDLAGYLRKTYTHLSRSSMITVGEEMELVDFYLEIEKKRFPNMIKVERQIDLPDFKIPVFCIEPLVENAVRHGIREKEEPGMISIQVKEVGKNVEICVSDTGIGFDINSIEKDGKDHIGLHNVRTRIELMTNGNFTIVSKPGIGTRAVICLPKE